MSHSLEKLEESWEKDQPEVDVSDRGISNMLTSAACVSLGRLLLLSPEELSTPQL
uniref:Uncharacterized protein n=1 Tax=Sus scrofa TaxID=9823 RepID=A0A4X1UE51_PIG